ncbi:VOC family protein, partial [Klebsiella quasipneumoniae subsp. similipneumoniae]
MLAYITIGTNDFQRSVDFYDAIFNVLGYSRLPAWTESWAMWGDKNNP